MSRNLAAAFYDGQTLAKRSSRHAAVFAGFCNASASTDVCVRLSASANVNLGSGGGEFHMFTLF